jgi:putative protease
MNRRPEVLAPAGDRACLEAAVRAGADAVYFGLQGFNARARAANFDASALRETMRYLHEHGRRGYVTLNTLVFDEELGALELAIRACAEAGVDAVIVQDLGVAQCARGHTEDGDSRLHADDLHRRGLGRARARTRSVAGHSRA